MIQKIQKLFHTDKWWGKTIFIISLYVLYWFIFYFLLFFTAWFLGEFLGGWFILLYVLFMILFSFVFIPKNINKIFYFNKFILYFLHTFLTLVSILCLILFILYKFKLSMGGAFL